MAPKVPRVAGKAALRCIAGLPGPVLIGQLRGGVGHLGELALCDNALNFGPLRRIPCHEHDLRSAAQNWDEPLMDKREAEYANNDLRHDQWEAPGPVAVPGVNIDWTHLNTDFHPTQFAQRSLAETKCYMEVVSTPSPHSPHKQRGIRAMSQRACSGLWPQSSPGDRDPL